MSQYPQARDVFVENQVHECQKLDQKEVASTEVFIEDHKYDTHQKVISRRSQSWENRLRPQACMCGMAAALGRVDSWAFQGLYQQNEV